tara:strand:+ start:861 stop:1748 length:888 start_codon:yes stop_codon:yes gene_type:complete
MALLLVLVTVMALVIIVGGLWQASQPGWEENDYERARYRAGLLAESGFSLAMHPDIAPGDIALQQLLGPEKGIKVFITSEGGRIPVNELTDERWRDGLVELCILWGMDAASGSRVADSLADWIDEDGETFSNGAENPYYAGLERPEYPANVPFTSLEQMLLVAGMDELARSQPMWRDYFTIHSDGLLDFNAASWEAIAALTGTTQDSAMNFVAVRNGDDGIQGTIDDYRLADMGEVQALLGLSDSEMTGITDIVTLEGSVVRIESTGEFGDFTETRLMLARQVATGLSPLARFRK